MFVFSVARPFVCGCHIISTLPSARTIPGLPGSLASLLNRVARTHLGAMGWNQCAFAPIVRARPFPIFGRPVHPRDGSRRLRPGGSPHALQTPPRGGRPALQSFRSWLQLCLGRIRLSPSCPFRHLHYLSTLRPVRHYPHLLDIDPWPRAERDFNPPETRAARHALPMDLPPSASSPLRGRRSRFGFQYRVSADWITQCPLSVWVNAPTVGPDIEAIGLPGVRGSNVKVVFRDFQLRENDRFVVRAVGTVRTPEVFQGPVEIIKKKPPKATDSPDFHRPGSFHSPRRPLKLKRAPVHAGALDLSHQLFSYGVEPNVYRSE